MPLDTSLMIPATQLHRTSSPSSGLSENFKSSSYSLFFVDKVQQAMGKGYWKKPFMDPWGLSSRILLLWIVESCITAWRAIPVRDTTSLKAGAKLAPWQRNEHRKPHSLLLQVYSSILLSFVPESCKVRILFLKKIQAMQPTPLKRKGAKSKPLCPVTCNQYNMGIVYEWKWSCCAQRLSANIATYTHYSTEIPYRHT